MIVVRLLYRQDEIIPFLWFEVIWTTSEKSLNQTQMTLNSDLYTHTGKFQSRIIGPPPTSTPDRIESAYLDLNL